MPRDGQKVYSKPPGTTAIDGQVIEASQYNPLMDDIVQDLNTPRPVEMGGTGGTDPASGRAGIGAAANSEVLKKAATNQAVSGGGYVDPVHDAGTITTGTVTLDVGTSPHWTYVNNGAHTLDIAAKAGPGGVVDIINGADAGTITMADGVRKRGSTLTLTEGAKFRAGFSYGPAGKLLIVQEMND